MPNKVVRLYLHYENTNVLSYETFCVEVRKIQEQIRSSKNAISSAMYFDILGEKPIIHNKTKQNYCYHIACERIPFLNSLNISVIANSAFKVYNGKRGKEFWSGKSSAMSFKSGQPINLAAKNVKLLFEDGCKYLEVSLLSRNGMKQYGMKTGEIIFQIVRTKDYQNTILDRCVSGEYKIAESALMYDKKKKSWYINLGYTFIPDRAKLDPHKILGVDVGMAYPFYAATDIGWDRKFVKGSKIESFRRQVEERRRDLMRSAVYTHGGHGRKKRMAVVDRLSGKIENFRNTTNFTYAKAIVDFAIQQGCGTIQMEDLSGISANNKFLKNWSYFDLQTKVEHKATERGLVFRKINPQYTSQRCHCCGWIDKASRLSQADFICTNCGHKDNADRNAARNIAMDGIEKIIKEQCELQGLPYRDKEKAVA